MSTLEKQTALEAGGEFSVQYPFRKAKVSLFDGESMAEVDSWVPGTRGEYFINHWNEPDTEMVADGMGKQLFKIISVHKPGKYPTRIFYIQQWQTPDGKWFGKNKLRIITQGAFRTKLRGFRHEYKLLQPKRIPEHA